ncbi:hypothetical protein IAR55_001997 [Kwoniella newhampshirensis]|uniref:Zn(2)-C6 fungal-type domain-containing protein n=1 Tax=Kwoniella newhampshirensis TaxID=1651941 RepID=A0AAW0Z3M8_9TREE
MRRRCDETKPDCRRCSRQGIPCVYPKHLPAGTDSNSSSSSYPASHQPPSSEGIVTTTEATPWSSHSAMMLPLELPPVDLIAWIFPDRDERELMSHFLCFGTVNMCAIPQLDKPIRFFDVAHHIQNPRGSSVVSDSLLFSLLAVAALHRSAIFSQQEQGFLTVSPVGRWGTPPLPPFPPTSSTISRLKAIGTHFSNTSIEMSRTAMVVKLSDEDVCEESLIHILESLVSSLISQSMLGGTHWKEAFNIALAIIDIKGGPEKMLATAKRTSSWALTKIRSSLEDLAFVDTMVCLGTGSRPRLLLEPFQPWWFDYASEDDQDGLDTFQFAFGLDRGVLELTNRVNMLVYERHLLVNLSESEYMECHDRKVNDIILELEVWESGIDRDNLSRVDLGNIVMIHTMRVTVYIQLLGFPTSHTAVQSSALTALRLLDKAQHQYTIGLLVPKIIIGSVMLDAAGQDLAMKTFTYLRSTLCYERGQDHNEVNWHKYLGHALLF